jgi:hypothetical protein
VTETYQYDSLSGLLTRQKVIKGGNNLLDLSYDYAKNNSVGTGNGKTGHLTKTTDNLNNAKNKEYEFDALGRLTKAKGGVQSSNFSWQQTYSYDRFGNRLNVVATRNGIDGQPMQKERNADTLVCTDAGAFEECLGNFKLGVFKRRQIADAILQTRVSAFQSQAGSPRSVELTFEAISN